MNHNVTTTFNFQGDTLKRMQDLAQKDYELWMKKKGQAQCLNTFDSCLRGITGELAASAYVKKCFEYMGKKAGVKNLAIEERQRGVTFTKGMRGYGDIIAGEINEDGKTFNIGLKVEVKSIAAHHPRGQILPYHVNKYINNDIDYVVFVKVEELWDDNMSMYLRATVYESASPKDIRKWPKANNLYGKACYESPRI